MAYADKNFTLGGGPPGTPVGTLAEIAQRALAPFGYAVRIDPDAARGRSPGMVAAGELELGAWNSMAVRWAYAGVHDYKDNRLPRLRAIAHAMMSAWYGVAVRWETGITDLAQIRERRIPVRVFGGPGGAIFKRVLAHYGLSPELIESYGGRIMPYSPRVVGAESPMAPWVRTGEVDVIMENIYAAYTRENAYWWEASVLMNLRFLPLPDDLAQTLCRDYGGEPGFIPYRLVRGVTAPVASILRPPQMLFCRDDLPDDAAYLVARALDQGRRFFRETLIGYSYDSSTVAGDYGVPLHPGAQRYYREAGYLRS